MPSKPDSAAEQPNSSADVQLDDSSIKEVEGVGDKLFSGETSFAEAFHNADEISTAGIDGDLLKGDILLQLERVPFLVVGGTFRDRLMEGKKTTMVTLDCMVASESVLSARKVSLNSKPDIFPEMPFLMNDGSTGVRRQVVAYLHTRGYIRVQPLKDTLIESGKLGESSFDRQVVDWDDYSIGNLTFNRDGLAVWDFKLPVGLAATRGLRISSYRGPFGKDVVTKYLA